MATDTLPLDMAAYRERLLSVARPYADTLRSRPGLVGILLYGSLVRGSLTPFSDIDMALFYEGDLPHRFEFRRVDGQKVDMISFPLEQLTKLLDPLPRSMDAGFPFSSVLQSLLLAGNESILYDPTGELQRVKTRLNEEVSFSALNRVSLSNGYHHFYRPNVAAARSLLEQGDAAGALDKAKWCGFALTMLVKDATVLKDAREAAERLGTPEFAEKREALARMMAPSDDAAEAVWAATQALWDYALSVAASPLKERLREQGVKETDRLELAGEYNLFWPFNVLYEFGRLMEEVSFSLRVSRYDLDRGKGMEALGHLFACRGTQNIRTRWEKLDAALKDNGYDGSSVIQPMLDSAEFARLGERLDQTMEGIERKVEVTPEAAQAALALVEEMERSLLGVISFMSEEEIAVWKSQSEEKTRD